MCLALGVFSFTYVVSRLEFHCCIAIFSYHITQVPPLKHLFVVFYWSSDSINSSVATSFGVELKLLSPAKRKNDEGVT